MDRQFPTPQDAARAGAERLYEALNARLRRGVTAQPFVLRQRFEYDGGRRGPMLFIGNINRAWRDYVNGNARATDLVTGTCSSSREAGRAVVSMQVSAGRGATSGNQLELNRALRSVNVEVRFNAEDGAAAPAAARPDLTSTPGQQAADNTQGDAAASGADRSPVPAGAGAPEAGGGVVAVTGPALAQLARELKSRFDTFKTSPSREGLDELRSMIAKWHDGAAQVDGAERSKTGEFVSKLAALLDARGEAFVSQKNG